MIIEEIACEFSVEDLFAHLSERPGSFLLDSGLDVVGTGGWSFMGCEPFLVFRATGDEIVLQGGANRESRSGNAWNELQRLCREYRVEHSTEIPFVGGAVGFFSYEAGARLENVGCRDRLEKRATPDMEFGFYDGVLAYEHASGRLVAIAHAAGGRPAEKVMAGLRDVVTEARKSARNPQPVRPAPRAAEPRALFAKADYLAAVRRIKEYIAAGDVYQVNLTQCFEAPLAMTSWELYRRLRRRSPAPFATYLRLGDADIVSSSPERFLSVDRNGRVETRPIKGTRPRGQNAADDERLARELLASEKDRAELLMIVDLERNDLGRVCMPGSIRVEELYRVEKHPTVFHLVATVSGQLRPGADVFDCIRAAFPGGSITGAPKIRAMQIIDELEPCRRGVYTGAIGYLGFDGTCDFNIAIRTIVCAGGRASYHVGGGIVWDSDPEAEYQETLDKARAMRAALVDPE